MAPKVSGTLLSSAWSLSSSSPCSRTRSAILRSTRARSPARVRGHGPSSNATRAARTARSTSAGPAIGNEATSSPVAG
jgi:hypothetical protein